MQDKSSVERCPMSRADSGSPWQGCARGTEPGMPGLHHLAVQPLGKAVLPRLWHTRSPVIPCRWNDPGEVHVIPADRWLWGCSESLPATRRAAWGGWSSGVSDAETSLPLGLALVLKMKGFARG